MLRDPPTGFSAPLGTLCHVWIVRVRVWFFGLTMQSRNAVALPLLSSPVRSHNSRQTSILH